MASQQEFNLIDLSKEISKTINKWFSNAKESILFQISLFWKFKFLFIVFILAGLALTILFDHSQKKFYKSNMTLQVNILNAQDFISQLNQINVKTYAKDLGIDVKQLRSINAFNYTDIDNNGIPELIDYNKNRLSTDSILRLYHPALIRIEVEVFDTTILDSTLAKQILVYFNKNKYFKDKNQERYLYLNNSIEIYTKEIEKLDSLQSLDYFKYRALQYQSNNVIVNSDAKTLHLYHETIINLKLKLQEFVTQKEFRKEIAEIKIPFNTNAIEENSMFKHLTIGTLITFLISIILLNIIYTRKSN